MAQIFVALAAIAALIAMSVRANQRFRKEARLPMQWSFTGSVNWTAPRSIALAFTPALGSCILLAVFVSTWMAQPRPGQEGLEVPVVLAIGLGLVAVHALHLWLIAKAVRNRS